MRDAIDVPISRGQLAKTIRKASEAQEAPYTGLMPLLRSQDRLNGDETGQKDNGKRFWTWCFRAANFTTFKVAGPRSSNVLFDVLGPEFSGVLGCAFFSAQQKYMKGCDGRVRLCLAHFIREIKFLTTLSGTATANYGKYLFQKMRELLRVIHQHDRKPAAAFNKALAHAREAVFHGQEQTTWRYGPCGKASLIYG